MLWGTIFIDVNGQILEKQSGHTAGQITPPFIQDVRWSTKKFLYEGNWMIVNRRKDTKEAATLFKRKSFFKGKSKI